MGGATRIPWRSIDDYAESQGFADSHLLARLMWAMDDVYLAWLTEQQKSTNDNAD